MGPMPKKKSLTVRRVLVLLLAYIMLAVCGGVATSVLLIPGVIGANNVAKAVIPSLKVENVDFDVTSLPQKSTMYASDGTTVITDFYSQNRIVVPLKKISKVMQQAVVAREDRRFWTHAGVDVQGVMRAFVNTYLLKGDQQGGSSLTQQYVKNVLLMQAIEDNDSIAQYHATEDTVARKIREMLISVQMEKKYTKAEILQGYLNIAQFGSNLYGVETAAQRYFSVSAADLNAVQAATIAAITKNPNKYDPLIEANQEESQKQRNLVLDLMAQEGYISEKECTEAKNTPLKDTLKVQDVNVGCQDTGDYAFFCDYVVHRIQNSEEFGKTAAERSKLLQEGGLKIVTTLDVDATRMLMDTARNTIPPDDPSGTTVNPESPFLGLVRSHNTTQASMGTIMKLCKVADTATELGYHDARTGETIEKTSSYTPSMMVGSVNVSPLTMASIFAVYAANGVQCNPIAITKVTDGDGNDLKVPSANCHQAVDPEIIQTLAYTLNQGVTRSDGQGHNFQLNNGRKSFGKTGTSEDLAVASGSFIPNQIASFASVGDAQAPYSHRIANIRINGVYNSYWDGSTIAAPALRNFLNAYADAKQLPIDNDYGQGVAKYMTSGTTFGIAGRSYSTRRSTTTNNDNNNNDSSTNNESNNSQNDQ